MKVYVSLGKFNKKIFTKNFLYKIFYTEKITIYYRVRRPAKNHTPVLIFGRKYPTGLFRWALSYVHMCN